VVASKTKYLSRIVDEIGAIDVMMNPTPMGIPDESLIKNGAQMHLIPMTFWGVSDDIFGVV
jgi:hypothetical protein